MDRDVCGTCCYKNLCPERSRMYPCSTYKKRTLAAATAKDPERNKLTRFHYIEKGRKNQ